VLIRGGRIIDPARRLDAILDLRLRGGVVAEIGEDLQADAGEETFDAAGAFVAPGFLDMHVHLRVPGNPEKETIETGTAAAVAGGFTAVAAMPNTNPAIDTPDLVADLRSQRASCAIHPIAAITKARLGETLTDYGALRRAGAVAFSDDGSTVMNAKVLRDAANAARATRAPFVVHCEDECLKSGAVMTQGAAAERLGVKGAPSIAEDVIVARDAVIARETGVPWHVAHVSTAGSIRLLGAAREAGAAMTCEVTPHHLVFSDEDVERLGGAARVNPPLRSREDVHALRRAVLAHAVDAFASDHAPHTAAEKSGPLHACAVGFTGLEIAVGAYAYALPTLPIARFVEMLSLNPARILGVAGGTLAPGSPADVTIFADREWTVDPQRFRSKGKSTPFAGMTLPRRVLATIVGGVLAYDAAAKGSA